MTTRALVAYLATAALVLGVTVPGCVLLWMRHGPVVGLLTLACSGHAAGWLASRVVWDAQN
ncbi:MAG: hypothetical protein U0804_28580 [Gemmataceae bacterium]